MDMKDEVVTEIGMDKNTWTPCLLQQWYFNKDVCSAKEHTGQYHLFKSNYSLENKRVAMKTLVYYVENIMSK